MGAASYDAIIVGVGQAGNPLARFLSAKGYKLALVERAQVGGTCINTGCTPTKTLIASAKAVHQSQRAHVFGLQGQPLQVNFEAVMARQQVVVRSFREHLLHYLQQDPNISLLQGQASFTSATELLVRPQEGPEQHITAPKIFLNTGTRPRSPHLLGLEQIPYLTSDNILQLKQLPQHLIILGAGYIGLEFAQLFRRLGSQVTVLEAGENILPKEDAEFGLAVQQFLAAEGVELLLTATASAVTQQGNSLTLQLTVGGQRQQVQGTHLLLATGTQPNTEALNLPAAHIAVDAHGFIQVDEYLQTSQPGIYALGDVKGGPAFTHVSYDDYRIVAHNLFHQPGEWHSTKGRIVPYVMFTDPELAHVGLNEAQAKQQGIAYKVASLPMHAVARAIEASETLGLIKALVDKASGKIIGATVLAAGGGELMALLQLAMQNGIPYTALRDGIFAHPTYAESLNNLFQ